jgi:hypothetical protein
MTIMKPWFRAALPAALLLCSATAAFAWPAEVIEEIELRDRPTTRSRVLDVVPEGVIVDVIRCFDRDDWCLVAFEDTEGYARRRYLDRIGDRYIGPRLDLYWDILPRYRPPSHPRYIPRPPVGGPPVDYRDYRREQRPAGPGAPPPRFDQGPSRIDQGPPRGQPPGGAPSGQPPAPRGQPGKVPPQDLPGAPPGAPQGGPLLPR